MLEQLEYEREVKVHHRCFICDQILNDTYQVILSHYTEEHKLRVGYKPGCVYIATLLKKFK